MTSQSGSNQVDTLTFAEKYGLKFYSFLIPQIIAISMLLITDNSPLALAFTGFSNIIGNFLPIKAKDDKHLSKIQNDNVYLLGPLIVSCLSTPTIIFVIWRNYDFLVKESFFYNLNLLFLIAFLISSSIDAAHELLHRA